MTWSLMRKVKDAAVVYEAVVDQKVKDAAVWFMGRWLMRR